MSNTGQSVLLSSDLLSSDYFSLYISSLCVDANSFKGNASENSVISTSSLRVPKHKA